MNLLINDKKEGFMKKAQIVSMDFIMTFVVYLFALAVFFFAMKNAVSYTTTDLDVSADVLFNRIDQTYFEPYDFMDGSKINSEHLDDFLRDRYTPESMYDFVFKDFENSGTFSRIDYCIYLENKTENKREIIRNFAAYSLWSKNQGSSVVFSGNILCADDIDEADNLYLNFNPRCKGANIESIILTKPVLYGKDIIDMKVLVCAKRR
jgi:hypothetical protein